MLREAAEEARRVRQNWLGPEHFLLAVLSRRSTATDVMEQLGVTHDRLAGRLSEFKQVSGRRLRYHESKGVITNPAGYKVIGWAKGFAAASGRAQPSPEDWLLAIVYTDSMAASVLDGLGVTAASIVEQLRRRGVNAPPFEPPAHRPWRGHHEAEVGRSDFQAMVNELSRLHPPGSEWQWGFNSRRDRPGKIQFVAEEGVDLESIVDQLRAARSS